MYFFQYPVMDLLTPFVFFSISGYGLWPEVGSSDQWSGWHPDNHGDSKEDSRSRNWHGHEDWFGKLNASATENVYQINGIFGKWLNLFQTVFDFSR